LCRAAPGRRACTRGYEAGMLDEEVGGDAHGRQTNSTQNSKRKTQKKGGLEKQGRRAQASACAESGGDLAL
jgi:hypothetical protein